ncbi:MAG: hypothetical protein WD981_01420 [Gaiellaceae bacterium]
MDHPDIWVMNADGTQIRNLTRDALRRNGDPVYSPDGRRIAFQAGANREGATSNIYVMNADGSGQQRVTNDPTTSNDSHPSWSPDGSLIAFDRRNDQLQRTEIWAVQPDGSRERRLSASTGNDASPSWSPDGTRIAFSSTRDGNWEIYVMRADGSGQVRVTATPTRDEGEPSWSPDGTLLAYSAGRGSARDIYVANADGSSERRVTQLARLVWRPRWSPDGSHIAFFEWPPAGGNLYTVNADGSGLTRFFPSLSVVRFATSPKRPIAGRTFSAVLRVTGTGAEMSVTCRANAPLAGKSLTAGRARCTWRVPPGAKGKRLRGWVAVSELGTTVRRSFAARVG